MEAYVCTMYLRMRMHCPTDRSRADSVGDELLLSRMKQTQREGEEEGEICTNVVRTYIWDCIILLVAFKHIPNCSASSPAPWTMCSNSLRRTPYIFFLKANGEVLVT